MSRLIPISEIQFAFAYFHHFKTYYSDPSFQFYVPTLREEGAHPAGGYDISLNGSLIGNHFIQFKRPEYFRWTSRPDYYTTEMKEGKLNPNTDYPYYRYGIYNSITTEQHNKLKNLARNPENTVLYVSANFMDEEGFSVFMNTASDIALQSYLVSIDVKEFFNFPDIEVDSNHVICYNQHSLDGSFCYFFSESKRLPVLTKNNFFKLSKSFIKEQSFQTEIKLSLIEYAYESVLPALDIKQTNIKSSLVEIQNLIVRETDIFWIPFTKTE